jgi:hypothetical protein
MLNLLGWNCMGCQPQDVEMSQREKQQKLVDQNKEVTADGVDKEKQEVLKTFSQFHILESYQKLGKDQQRRLISDVDMIHFDFVDLVFHNLVKKQQPKIKAKYLPLKPESFIRPDNCAEDCNETLKLISQGRFAIAVAAGMSRKYGLETPKLLIKPDWGGEDTLIEYLIHRIRSIGKQAIDRFGKNYEKKREPIIIYIMVNSAEIENVQSYLNSVRNFNYPGIVTFGQDVLPYINERGEMVFKDMNKDRLKLVSNGSGALLSALSSQGVLEHLLSSGVQVLQYVNLNNLMVPLAEPRMVQECKKGADIVVQMSHRDLDQAEIFPTILQDPETGTFEYLNVRETTSYLAHRDTPRLDFECKALNVYVSIDLFRRAVSSKHLLFEYRIKEKIKAELPDPLRPQTISDCDYYSFELHFLNLIKIASNPRFAQITPGREVIAIDIMPKSVYKSFTLPDAVKDMLDNIETILTSSSPPSLHKTISKLTPKQKRLAYSMVGHSSDPEVIAAAIKKASDS